MLSGSGSTIFCVGPPTNDIDTWQDEIMAKHDVEVYEELFCRRTLHARLIARSHAQSMPHAALASLSLSPYAPHHTLIACILAMPLAALASLASPRRRLDDEQLWYAEQPAGAELSNIDEPESPLGVDLL